MTLKSSLDEYQQQSAPRILISGFSGLIGRAVIASRRRAGDVVVPLVRKKGTEGALLWNPESGTLDPALVSGLDTVIHLAGEPVVGLWTATKRRRIMESRVLGTTELATVLASAAQPRKSRAGVPFPRSSASLTFPWCRWPALVLDDPLQHNDSIHTAAFADLMSNLVQKRSYQVLISTHDMAQAEFLRRKLISRRIPCATLNLLGTGRDGVETSFQPAFS